jgi:hypothetical protein
MANNYSPHTAKECVPCSKLQFELLSQLLSGRSVTVAAGDGDDFEEDSNDHGFGIEFDERGDGDLYLFAELNGDESVLPAPFLKELGKLIAAAGMEFLEMGYANTCDKMRVNSHGGGYYRIMPSGEIVLPTLVWPSTPAEAALNAESPHPIP